MVQRGEVKEGVLLPRACGACYASKKACSGSAAPGEKCARCKARNQECVYGEREKRHVWAKKKRPAHSGGTLEAQYRRPQRARSRSSSEDDFEGGGGDDRGRHGGGDASSATVQQSHPLDGEEAEVQRRSESLFAAMIAAVHVLQAEEHVGGSATKRATTANRLQGAVGPRLGVAPRQQLFHNNPQAHHVRMAASAWAESALSGSFSGNGVAGSGGGKGPLPEIASHAHAMVLGKRKSDCEEAVLATRRQRLLVPAASDASNLKAPVPEKTVTSAYRQGPRYPATSTMREAVLLSTGGSPQQFSPWSQLDVERLLGKPMTQDGAHAGWAGASSGGGGGGGGGSSSSPRDLTAPGGLQPYQLPLQPQGGGAAPLGVVVAEDLTGPPPSDLPSFWHDASMAVQAPAPRALYQLQKPQDPQHPRRREHQEAQHQQWQQLQHQQEQRQQQQQRQQLQQQQQRQQLQQQQQQQQLQQQQQQQQLQQQQARRQQEKQQQQQEQQQQQQQVRRQQEEQQKQQNHQLQQQARRQQEEQQKQQIHGGTDKPGAASPFPSSSPPGSTAASPTRLALEGIQRAAVKPAMEGQPLRTPRTQLAPPVPLPLPLPVEARGAAADLVRGSGAFKLPPLVQGLGAPKQAERLPSLRHFGILMVLRDPATAPAEGGSAPSPPSGGAKSLSHPTGAAAAPAEPFGPSLLQGRSSNDSKTSAGGMAPREWTETAQRSAVSLPQSDAWRSCANSDASSEGRSISSSSGGGSGSDVSYVSRSSVSVEFDQRNSLIGRGGAPGHGGGHNELGLASYIAYHPQLSHQQQQQQLHQQHEHGAGSGGAAASWGCRCQWCQTASCWFDESSEKRGRVTAANGPPPLWARRYRGSSYVNMEEKKCMLDVREKGLGKQERTGATLDRYVVPEYA